MSINVSNEAVSADTVFINGNIYTQDTNLPWASSVACKDGRILAVGKEEGMTGIINDTTSVIDLDGKYVFPGFIDAHSSTILEVFRNTYLEVDPIWDLDTVLGEITNYCDTISDGETAFIYGFHESILKDYVTHEEKSKLLDEIETDCPIIALGIDGIHIWLNSIATEIVKTTCEDADIQVPSLLFILEALMVFDTDELRDKIEEEEERLTDKGITTIFNYASPICFDKLYCNAILERVGDSCPPKQGFYGSLYINCPLDTDVLLSILEYQNTFTGDLNDLMNYNFIKIEAGGPESLSFFSQDELNKLCLSVADKGYNIHIDALDKETLIKTYTVFDTLRSKGYLKNTLVIASDIKLTQEELMKYRYADTFCTTFSSDTLNNSVFSHSANIKQAIDHLTCNAAAIIGESNNLGSIEKGKIANFTVFTENLFDCTLKTFSRLHAEMVITGGQVIYDAEEENMNEMFNLLINMQM